MIFTALEIKLLTSACFARLTQSRERKKATLHYCARHKIHFHQRCVHCAVEEDLKHYKRLTTDD